MRAFRVTVAAEDEDLARRALWEAGTAGVEVRGGATGRVDLLAYFQDDATSRRQLRHLPPGATRRARRGPEVDWVARFREGFRAFRVGRFPVDAAVGRTPARRPPTALVVDPGRAFGTGTHETTRLCLGALEELAARRPARPDARPRLRHRRSWPSPPARLGAAPVVRLRHRPRGHRVLGPPRAAQRRPPAGCSAPTAAAACGPGSFDLVLANLMALLLVDRAAEIRALLAPGGALVLSGLLVDDVPAVREAFAACGSPASGWTESGPRSSSSDVR